MRSLALVVYCDHIQGVRFSTTLSVGFTHVCIDMLNLSTTNIWVLAVSQFLTLMIFVCIPMCIRFGIHIHTADNNNTFVL